MRNFLNSLSSSDIITIIGILVTFILAIEAGITTGKAMVMLFIIIGIFAAYKAQKTRLNDIPKEDNKPQPYRYKEVPYLLPYLPNLTKQEDELDKTIRRWNYRNLNQDEKYCPLVCIIRGDVDEDANLMARLKKYFAAKLNFNTTIGSKEEMYLNSDDDIKEIPLYATNFHKVANLPNEMWQRLKDRTCADYSGNDWKIEVGKTLVKKCCPIFIRASIDTTNWNKIRLEDFIQKFINFWYDKDDNWTTIVAQENLLFEHPLVVCLFFHYQKEKISAWQKLFKKKTSQLKLPELNFLEFYKRYQAYGVVLPALSSVDRNDVIAWAEIYQQTICQYCNTEMVKDEIYKLYNKPDDTIPMKKLGSELRRILETT